MVKITLATATARKQVIVEDNQKVKDVIADNGLDTVGMTYHANGTALTSLDVEAGTLGEEVVLVAVPAQKAGC